MFWSETLPTGTDKGEPPPHIMRRVSSGNNSSSEQSTMHHSHLAYYAAEILSRGPYATHTLSITLNCRFGALCDHSYGLAQLHTPDDQVQFLWLDRQNAIATKRFSLFDNFFLFVAFLVTLSRFTLDDWGIEERFYPKEDYIKTTIRENHTIEINAKLEPLCHRVTLIGRGTMVCKGLLNANGATTPVAIKISYPEEERVPEPEFIRIGRDLKNGVIQEYLPLVHAWEDSPYTTGKFRRQLNLDRKGQARKRRSVVLEQLESVDSLNKNEFRDAWVNCVVGEVFLLFYLRSTLKVKIC